MNPQGSLEVSLVIALCSSLVVVGLLLALGRARKAQRKLANQVDQLQDAHDLLRSAIDESPNVVLLKDWEGRFLVGNRALAQLYRTTPEALIGKDDGAFNPNQEQVEFFKKNVQEIMLGTETRVVLEESTDVATGETHFYQSIKKPLVSKTGGRRILVLANDVTDLKRAQRQLEQSEQRLTHVLAATGDGIWDWDIASGRLHNNLRWCEILGYPPGNQHRLEDFSDRLIEEEREGVFGAIDRSRSGKGPYRHEHRLRRPDGTIIWVLDRGDVVERDGEGKPVRMVGSVEDITERKASELALIEAKLQAEAATRAKSRFLANMSHEIRTPMNGVLGMAQLMNETPLSDPQKDYVGSILQSGRNLMAIINDVLDYSKIEAGALELQPQAVNLGVLLDEVTRIAAHAARRKGLTLEFDYPEALPRSVEADPVRLRQVLTNLVGNAVKFTDRGRVKVTVRRAGEGPFSICIEDTGIGIHPEVLPRLFSSFSQADASSTRRFGGTGLGLAISRRLVDLMRGEIHVTSEPGKGSAFTLELPLTVLGHQPVAAPQALTPPRFEGCRVLVAEDVVTNQQVAQVLLDRVGIEVTIVENGQAAVDAWDRGAFDLVLMDCQMPVLDGYEATRELRRREGEQGRPRTPIIAVTAHAMQDERKLSFEAGMDEHLAKPFWAEELHALLGRWLKPTSRTPALDQHLVDRMRAQLGASFPVLVRSFIGNTPAMIEKLGAAVKEGSAPGATGLAHALAGAGACFGLTHFVQLALGVEQQAAAGTLPAEADLQALHASFKNASGALNSLL